MSYEADWAVSDRMTEIEWLVSTNGPAMAMHLRHMIQRMSDRKRRLFECACCRRVWDQLPDSRSREAIELAEQLADGQVAEIELEAASVRAEEVWTLDKPDAFAEIEDVDEWQRAFYPLPLSAAAYNVTIPFGYWGGAPAFEAPSRIIREAASVESDERAAQADLLRCIFGNPFRPVVFAPSWRSETAVALAAGIYAERAFDRLPVLADALEETGCDHPDVLSHCRGPGPHARGCWVVDGVLGKE